MTSVLQFYSKSRSVAPFKGAGESLAPGDSADAYAELADIPHFRQVLSNFWETEKPIEIDGKRYATLEHAYHAAKFPEHPEFQRLFEADSKSAIGADPARAKSAGGKGGCIRVKDENKKPVVVFRRAAKVRADPAMLKAEALEATMERLMYAKFSQDALCKRVLLATGDAVLMHDMGRGKKVRFANLERVRTRLRKEAA